jgi:sugar lactone lactonase YvrE
LFPCSPPLLLLVSLPRIIRSESTTFKCSSGRDFAATAVRRLRQYGTRLPGWRKTRKAASRLSQAPDFGLIDGIAMDAAGAIYVSEQLRVDRISTDGRVEVLTGYLSEDDSGVRTFRDGPLNGVAGLAVDESGRLYIAVRQDGRILVATPRPAE